MDKNQVLIAEEVIKNEDEVELSPYKYFQSVKEKVQTMNDEELTRIYNNALVLADKYNRTGQTKGLKKLVFYIQSIIKEKKILSYGITKFVDRADIERYIDEVADKQVVILDIAHYERIIPDEIIEAMEKVKSLFDEFYIVCTDYNREISKAVQKERREKDPILFGAFLDRDKQTINDRFYYIGDWIDEYCDLTLEKMVAEELKVKGRNILNNVALIDIPETENELAAQLNKIDIEESILKDNSKRIQLTTLESFNNNPIKQETGIFSKIKTFLGKNND